MRVSDLAALLYPHLCITAAEPEQRSRRKDLEPCTRAARANIHPVNFLCAKKRMQGEG